MSPKQEYTSHRPLSYHGSTPLPAQTTSHRTDRPLNNSFRYSLSVQRDSQPSSTLGCLSIDNPSLITPSNSLSSAYYHHPTIGLLSRSTTSTTNHASKNRYALGPTYFSALIPTVSMNSLVMLASSSNSFSNYVNPANLSYPSASQSMPFLTTHDLSSISQNSLVGDASVFGSDSQAFLSPASEFAILDEDASLNDTESCKASDYFTTPKHAPSTMFSDPNKNSMPTPPQGTNQMLLSDYANSDGYHQALADTSPSSQTSNRVATNDVFSLANANVNSNQTQEFEFNSCDEMESPTPAASKIPPSTTSELQLFQLPYLGMSDSFLGAGNASNVWPAPFFPTLSDGLQHFGIQQIGQNQHASHQTNLFTHYDLSSRSNTECSIGSSYHSASSSPSVSSLQLSLSKESTPAPETFDQNSNNYLTNYLCLNPVPSYEIFGSQPSLYGSSSSGQLRYSTSHQMKNKSSGPERSINHRFICPKCGKGHSRQSNLLAHLRDTHSSQKKVFCDIPGCSKAYKRVSECRRHKKDMHGIPLPSELAGKTRRPRRLNPLPN